MWHRRNLTGQGLEGTPRGQLEMDRNPVGPRRSPRGRCPHLSRPNFLAAPIPADPTSGKQAAGSSSPSAPGTRRQSSQLPPGPGLTVRRAVGDTRPRMGRVGVVGVALRVQVVEKDVDFIRRQQLRRLHVVVRKARVVRVGVLRIQDRRVRHPARLLRRHLHGRRRRLEFWAEAAVVLRDRRGCEGCTRSRTPPKSRYGAS